MALLLLSAPDLTTPMSPPSREIPAMPLLTGFQDAMSRAYSAMNMEDRAYPRVYDTGGGCYTGYGTSMSRVQCGYAIALMPAQDPDVDDITEGMSGPILTRNFYRTQPLVWRNKDCLIGVTVSDVGRAKGFYPLFREAAQMIQDTCVTRARGGLIRFRHFEVIIFDARLLPGYEQQDTQDFIFNFASQRDNVPFSRGVIRSGQSLVRDS